MSTARATTTGNESNIFAAEQVNQIKTAESGRTDVPGLPRLGQEQLFKRGAGPAAGCLFTAVAVAVAGLA